MLGRDLLDGSDDFHPDLDLGLESAVELRRVIFDKRIDLLTQNPKVYDRLIVSFLSRRLDGMNFDI